MDEYFDLVVLSLLGVCVYQSMFCLCFGHTFWSFCSRHTVLLSIADIWHVLFLFCFFLSLFDSISLSYRPIKKYSGWIIMDCISKNVSNCFALWRAPVMVLDDAPLLLICCVFQHHKCPFYTLYQVNKHRMDDWQIAVLFVSLPMA